MIRQGAGEKWAGKEWVSPCRQGSTSGAAREKIQARSM